MEWLGNIPHYALSFIVVISVIVFIHEFGHYLAARLCGVKIDVFSIGFGREIFGFHDRHGTRWKFSLLPFGGYVKMYGDVGAASNTDPAALDAMNTRQKALSFHHKALWQKAVIVAAGPIANFVLTIIVFTYFTFSTGLTSTAPVVGEAIEGSAAFEAGLQAGDRITHIDGREVARFTDIARMVLVNVGTPVTLDMRRDGTKMRVTLTPRIVDDVDALGNAVQRPLIGIRSEQVSYQDVGLTTALRYAVQETYYLCVSSLEVLGQIIAGDRSAKELKGPIGIAKLSGDVTQAGETTQQALRTTLWFIALLSVNLGLINLFPIPMLDGGHLLYYAIEAVRGRPVAERFQEYGFRLGFVCIMLLMVFTVLNDARQLFF
jgi:regulator of sigma E protease